MKPVLQVLVASTRPGRVGLPVGKWLVAAAQEHGAFEVDLVDLAVLDLPFLDEPARLMPVGTSLKVGWTEDGVVPWKLTVHRLPCRIGG